MFELNDFVIRKTYSYDTRRLPVMSIPFCESVFYRTSIKYSGPCIWNDLNLVLDLNVITSVDNFKSVFSNLLLSKYC